MIIGTDMTKWGTRRGVKCKRDVQCAEWRWGLMSIAQPCVTDVHTDA